MSGKAVSASGWQKGPKGQFFANWRILDKKDQVVSSLSVVVQISPSIAGPHFRHIRIGMSPTVFVGEGTLTLGLKLRRDKKEKKIQVKAFYDEGSEHGLVSPTTIESAMLCISIFEKVDDFTITLYTESGKKLGTWTLPNEDNNFLKLEKISLEEIS